MVVRAHGRLHAGYPLILAGCTNPNLSYPPGSVSSGYAKLRCPSPERAQRSHVRLWHASSARGRRHARNRQSTCYADTSGTKPPSSIRSEPFSVLAWVTTFWAGTARSTAIVSIRLTRSCKWANRCSQPRSIRSRSADGTLASLDGIMNFARLCVMAAVFDLLRTSWTHLSHSRQCCCITRRSA